MSNDKVLLEFRSLFVRATEGMNASEAMELLDEVKEELELMVSGMGA